MTEFHTTGEPLVCEWPRPRQLRRTEVWGGNQATTENLEVPGIDAWVFSHPYHGDVDGGDVHYVSTCGEAKISRFAVADVSGHGTTAGVLGKSLKRLMEKHVNTRDQSDFVSAINSEFLNLSHSGQFATALLMTFFAPNDELVVCNLGHPRPIVYRHSTNEWSFLESRFTAEAHAALNLPFGVLEGEPNLQFATQLRHGDLVVIYTDALIEARNADGEMLEEGGLLNLVRTATTRRPSAVGREIMAGIAEYRTAMVADDDETLLVLCRNSVEWVR